jgi:hypothetical protein
MELTAVREYQSPSRPLPDLLGVSAVNRAAPTRIETAGATARMC